MINNDNLSVNDFGKICRTCLAEGDMKLLFEKCSEQSCLTEMLMSVSFVQVFEKDGLPVQICLNCVSEITRAYRFVQKCSEVDRKLRKCLQEFQEKTNNEANFVSSQPTEKPQPKKIALQIKTEIEEIQNDINFEIVLIKPELSENNNKTYEMESDDNLDFLPKNEETNECSALNSENHATNEVKQSVHQIKAPPKRENCTICSKSIVSCKMVQHMRIHNGEKPFCCKICGKSFGVKGALTQHFKIHTGDKPHKCIICEKRFIQSTKLKEHMRLHSGEKPYVCNYCGKQCRLKNDLDLHMRRHTGEKPFKCKVCEKTFSHSTSLKTHLEIHSDKAYKCNYCDKTFVQSQSLKRHLETHAEEKTNTPNLQTEHECEICHQKLSKLSLKNHLLTHGEKQFLCNHCGRGFFTKASLKNHIRVHTGVKPYSCQTCGKCFSQPFNLKSHILTHTGEKPYVCKICNRGFTQSHQLKYHMRTHSGERPYSCAICCKSFSLKVNLKVHMRIHTGERPYECSVCKKGFYDSSNMKKHEVKHEKYAGN